METRFRLVTELPDAYKTFLDLDRTLAASGLDKIQREMIKIRASQINGCAYCLNIHTKDALKYGEAQQRIFVMSAWREAKNLFSEADQLILELTEEVTLIANHGVSDRVFNKAVELFGKEKTGYLILAIISINAWNRLGIAFGMHPE